MPFGIIGRTNPGMTQVVGFGDRSRGGGTLGANLGRAIVTNRDLLSRRRGPLPKLLWADLFSVPATAVRHRSYCSINEINCIAGANNRRLGTQTDLVRVFNFVRVCSNQRHGARSGGDLVHVLKVTGNFIQCANQLSTQLEARNMTEQLLGNHKQNE